MGILKVGVVATSGWGGLVVGKWESGRKKRFHTCGSLFSSLKNSQSVRWQWRALGGTGVAVRPWGGAGIPRAVVRRR